MVTAVALALLRKTDEVRHGREEEAKKGNVCGALHDGH